ncbi:MAG: OsmC family protein [Gammaproteobacteria bacterium]
MKIVLHNDTDLSVSHFPQNGFDIDSVDPQVHFGAMHLFVASVAWCTYAVLASYGQRIDAATDDLSIRLRWGYVERPHRLGRIDMAIHWPQVPESRLDAAMRAAASCTLHNSLQHGVEIDTSIERAANAGKLDA